MYPTIPRPGSQGKASARTATGLHAVARPDSDAPPSVSRRQSFLAGLRVVTSEDGVVIDEVGWRKLLEANVEIILQEITDLGEVMADGTVRMNRDHAAILSQGVEHQHAIAGVYQRIESMEADHQAAHRTLLERLLANHEETRHLIAALREQVGGELTGLKQHDSKHDDADLQAAAQHEKLRQALEAEQAARKALEEKSAAQSTTISELKTRDEEQSATLALHSRLINPKTAAAAGVGITGTLGSIALVFSQFWPVIGPWLSKLFGKH